MKGRKGPKLPGIIKPAPTPPPPAPPADLDKNTTITIDNKTFDIEADDLEVICELGNNYPITNIFQVDAIWFAY